MTAVIGPTQAAASEQPRSRSGDIGRAPPKAIQLLVPVWGTSFISQFLEVSLPTLLAPGNLPALAKALPCKLVFLTSSDDATILNDHPAIYYMRALCKVEISIIDDLITGDNYSTTITLAYARAVRAAGDAMLDTCFFFLISDYILADGSLANVLARMRAGHSGVVAGNFQVIEETAKSSFFKTFDSRKSQIAVRPRDLMRWALEYLHPMTLANMVNFPLCHSAHTNRLFWRVDGTTLIGRFYLMHMICIRPEIIDFVIGSSCDYSFIPEMCPSGDVHVLNDSDEYLVVEMQKRTHENYFLRLGGNNPWAVATSLAEWATTTHRRNAHSAVVFHAEDLPVDLDRVVAASRAYVDEIERSLPAPPPHRNHPYWLGAMAAHEWAVAQRKKMAAPPTSDMLGFPATGFGLWLYRFRNFVFGRPPNVRPWHPRWPDYRMLRILARRHFADANRPLLILSNAPEAFAELLRDVSQSTVSRDLNDFLMKRDRNEPPMRTFERCLLVLEEGQIDGVHEIIRGITPLFSNNGKLLIFVSGGHSANVAMGFSRTLLQDVGQFFHLNMQIDETLFVPTSQLQWSALRGMRSAFALIQKNRLWLAFESLIACILMGFSFICNLGRGSSANPPSDNQFSSFCLVMHRADRALALDDIESKPLDVPAQRVLWTWTSSSDGHGPKPAENIVGKE